MFNRVTQAYEILSNEETREAYDNGVSFSEIKHNQDQKFHFNTSHQAPGLFDNTDVFKLDLNTIGQFYQRKEVWLVYLQMPWMETVVRSR